MLKSKTMWFAAVLAGLGVFEQSSGALHALVNQQTYGWIMLGVAVVIAGLRVVTTQPLSEKQ